jgi:UDP-GlcNAc:undecaprenyl-phosphate/decaprenyl-phosphate GlcNAc-1-phosphate transferase
MELILASTAVACIVTFSIVPLLIRSAYKLHFLDMPGPLKQQVRPVPYLGGVAVYGGFLTAIFMFYPLESRELLFIAGWTFLLILGLLDDWLRLQAHQKFCGQVCATLFFIQGGLFIWPPALPLWWYSFYLLLAVWWLVTVMNAFNLVDVMDGLATVLALMAAFGFFIVACFVHVAPVALCMAVFIGALLGFLWYNRPPARIYLGDAGSLFIGGVMAVTPFMLIQQVAVGDTLVISGTILLLPLLELITLMLIRWSQGIPFYVGSPHHFSHFLQAWGWSPEEILIYVICCSLLLHGIAYAYLNRVLGIQALAGVIALFILAWSLQLFFMGKSKRELVQ